VPHHAATPGNKMEDFVNDFGTKMGVSKNIGTPKWMVEIMGTLLKWMIWGYHYFRKHPNQPEKWKEWDTVRKSLRPWKQS